MSIAVKISIPNFPADTLSREPRSHVMVPATIRTASTVPIDATLHDVSRSGCLLAADVEVKIGDVMLIGISGIGQVEAIVLRREGKLYGCQFMQMIPRKLVEAVHSADTVAPFTGRSIVNPIAFENSMPIPDRWSPALRFGALFGGGLIGWSIFLTMYKLL